MRPGIEILPLGARPVSGLANVLGNTSITPTLGVRGVAYVLSIGTKNTQARDIADARRAARHLKKELS